MRFSRESKRMRLPRGDGLRHRKLLQPQGIIALLLTPTLAFGFVISDMAGVASAQAVNDGMTTVPSDDNGNSSKTTQDKTAPAPTPTQDPQNDTPKPPDPGTTTPVDPNATPAPDPAPQDTPKLNTPTPFAASDALITPFSVPGPSDTTSVITVKVGGDRSTLTSVAPLAGVTLQLYDGGSGGPNASPRPEAWATCVSDADGDCSFTIPDTQNAVGTDPAGVNRNARFWIKQAGVPSGYFANNTLATGTSPTSAAYQFRTGAQLLPNTTYTSTVDFMIASGSTNNQASGGIWQTSRNNPAFPDQCGLSVALIVDLSGSVSPYITQLRSAAKGFVDALTGTPSEVALYTFANVAPAPTGANLNTTAVSTAAGATIVKNRIDTYTAGGTTNWDRGIFQAVGSPTMFDVAVVLTDGNPTSYAGSEGPGNRTRFRETENGIFSANALKAQNTKVIAFGVGDGVSGSPDNLRAISGPVAGSDYYQSADFAAAGATLRQLALGNCAGSVSIVKQVVPSTNIGEDITGATPESDWNFTANTSTPGVTPLSQNGTTDGTGAVNFPMTFAGGTTSGTINVAETQQPGHTLVTQGGKRAVCTNIATGAGVTVTNDPGNPNGFTLDVPATAAITCHVYNRAPQPLTSLTVDKTWVVNGVTYSDGNQPIGINAQLQLSGTNQNWSTPRTGLTVGDGLEISELTTFTGRDMCTLTDQKITNQNGSPVSLSLPYSATLAVTNQYTITNTVTCTAELTLVKQVQGGSADPTSWTLDAIAPTGSLPGPNGASGSTGATAEVTPEVSYPLAESNGSPLYTQTIIQGGNPQPPSTGSWSCVQLNAQGQVVPGFADGINGAVIVPLGFKVRCTAVNRTASLTLVKQVVNDDGGTRVPADWDLTATPTGSVPAGVVAQTVQGSDTGETISVRPGTTYNLSESSLAGYSLTSLRCDNGPGGTFVDATSVTVSALDSVTCVYVNDDQKATLSLVKVVDNGVTDATSQPSAWTLTAEGPDTVSGAGSSPEVTNQAVTSGVYDLSESGPGGYTASDWICTGAQVSDESSVTLTPGENATCTITNTAIAPVITLEKVVENTHGGQRLPADFRLTAAGGSVVDGFSGDPAVTAVPVAVGSYDLSEVNTDPLGYQLSDLSCENSGTGLPTSVAEPTVSLALGDNVVCRFVNTDRPATLTLIKDVEDNNTGSTKVPADWTLSAEPVNIAGQDPVSGNGTGIASEGGVETASVFAGNYTLAEDGPSGFSSGEWECTGGVVDGDVVTVPNGGNVICTITNTAVAPKLTLIKNVDNGTTDGDAVPRDWTLTATGATPITGRTGDPSITAASVNIGGYDLSEVGSVVGYTPGSWSCDGGSLSGNTVTLAEGEDVTCQITNTAEASVWNVAKSSSPTSGATVLPGDTVTYTVTATHTAGVDPDDLLITDDLSDVLDDATLQGTPTASNGTATLNGTTLEWSLDTLSTTATVTYTVKVNDDAYGVTLRNVVTPPPGSTCVGDCETTHYTPKWDLKKSSDPATGSVVDPGSTTTYTLHAINTSQAVVAGAIATDIMSGVMNHATLVQPLDPSLSFDPDAQTLRWNIPTMQPGDPEVTVSYQVVVLPDAYGETIANVVTPGPGGECPMPELFRARTSGPVTLAETDDCDTIERVKDVDLQLFKTHDPIPEVAVDSGENETIAYNLVVTNDGQDPATNVVVTDVLPAGLSYAEGTLVAPAGWTAEFVGNALTATFAGPFNPGDTAEFAFDVRVGDLPRPSDEVSYTPIVNSACVTERETDTDPSDNCASDVTPVKSIAVIADAVCVNDTPLASYSVTPSNVGSLPTIAMVWWTQDAYENRDPEIDASDTAALLADGASKVDPIEVPVGWTNGTKIEGRILWPGAEVDADGNPIAWPGWTQKADGTWVLDPDAPFYNLRGEAVMEIRINPSSSAVVVYPPATPNCAAEPPTVDPPEPPEPPKPPTPTPPAGTLSTTGADANIALMAGAGFLLLLGSLAVLIHRRRSSLRDSS